MDYTTQKLGFKIKKALRYLRLYGPRRTWIKIRGQYHMKKTYTSLPQLASPPAAGGHVGILGCGNFAFSNIAYYLRKNYGKVLRGAMDRQIERAASLYEEYGLRYYTDDARQIIEDPEVDLIFVASNHASHAEYAISALEHGKSVHIEKPHVVNDDQLLRLCRAMSREGGRVSLGFNRPSSRIGKAIRRELASQPGPAMLNWFLAGHELPEDHWYFAEEEGGRVLGNLCHWTDFVYQMVDPASRYPIIIVPTRWEKSDCDIAVSYVFGDGSIAAITFSAKGHTFEGVRESFSAHRGNILLSMSDFKWLNVENVERKTRVNNLFRDHGHESRIQRSYEMAGEGAAKNPGCSVDYVWETGELFLKTKLALDSNTRITVEAFTPGRLQDNEDTATAGRI